MLMTLIHPDRPPRTIEITFFGRSLLVSVHDRRFGDEHYEYEKPVDGQTPDRAVYQRTTWQPWLDPGDAPYVSCCRCGSVSETKPSYTDADAFYPDGCPNCRP